MSAKKRFEAKLTQNEFKDVKSIADLGDFETNSNFLLEASELLRWAIENCRNGYHIGAVNNEGDVISKYTSRHLRHLSLNGE